MTDIDTTTLVKPTRPDARPIDSLRAHPKAEMVPMPSPEDRASLARSMAENGQQDPIDITPDGVILDGRTRWTILKEQGATTVLVRERDIPEGQQALWIIDRAVARRHLTNHEKQLLNDYIHRQTIEVVVDPTTGEEARIGLSRPQRAEMLGVHVTTIEEWDKMPSGPGFPGPEPEPTHFRNTKGVVKPIHPKKKQKGRNKKSELRTREARRESTYGVAAPWWTSFVKYVKRPLPERRRFYEQGLRLCQQALETLDSDAEASTR